jgi:hypothetical protein
MEEGESPKPPEQGNEKTGRFLPDVAAARAEMAKEQAEDMKRVRAMSIDSFIGSITASESSNLKGPDYPNPFGLSQESIEKDNALVIRRMNRKIGVYSYLRDTHQAQTVGDAEEILRQHKVDPKIVRMWVEERMVDWTPFLSNPIAEGYPELTADMEKVRKEKRDELKRRVLGDKEETP